MTVYRPINIECDWPGCHARLDRGDLSLSSAKKVAAAEGWKNYRGLIDMCGPADRAPTWQTDERRRLQGHADADHQPKLTPVGKSLVDVACSCGWTDPTSYPASRGGSRYRWGEHIRKVTALPEGEPSPTPEVPVG